MAIFVHLAPEKAAARIRKNGLRPSPWLVQGRKIRVLFAMPVTPDFYISHQWLRELKRDGNRTMVGVYFKVRHDEEVFVGHYSRQPEPMQVGEAIRVFREAPDARGFQVLLPRRVEPKEIHRIQTLEPGIGWRYWPESHGRKPCPCEFCQRGRINSRRIREQNR